MTTATQLTEAETSRMADLGWIKIHYNEAGTGDPPVIFLHGSGCGASSWSNFVVNMPAFSAHYRTLAVDQPGYGKSDPFVMTEPRQTVNARAVHDLMDKLGIEKASLVGNSMGGATALAFAVDYPERLHKMVLMGSGGGGPTLFGQTPSEGIKALQAVYYDQSFEKFRAFFDVMLYNGKSVPDEVLKARAGSVDQRHVEAWKASLSAPTRNLLGDLPKVKHETLIIHGRNDRVVPMEGSMQLLTLLPNSQLHLFNECGHWVQYEQAKRFNKMVLDFLAEEK